MENQPHILVVNSDPDQLHLLIVALRSHSYHVTTALDGTQGYAQAITTRPDLILLDDYMPNKDGLTVARMLKINLATRHIPILFLSSSTDPAEHQIGLRAGAAGYITKPIDIDDVLQHLSTHLARTHAKTAAPPEPAPGAAASPAATAQAPQPLRPSVHVIMQAANLIASQMNPPIKASELAIKLNMSERRLNATFLENTGMSVFEYARDTRLRQAAHLLEQSELSVTRIAEETGYSSSANFATEFRKFWGKTPSEYRAQYQ